MKSILGINAYHGDASACLIRNGKLIAAAEEERFRRIKHWAGFPVKAIEYCLHAGKLRLTQIDHIAVNRDPYANIIKKGIYAIRRNPSILQIRERLKNAAKIRSLRKNLEAHFEVSQKDLQSEIHYIEHHNAHMASSFFVSPFNEAALVSLDGFGDFVSTMWGYGDGNRIQTIAKVLFPHSLGLFYLAITQYLGFLHYGDEYKVMGLAAYGKPTEMEKMRQIVQLKPNGGFELNLQYFRHAKEGFSMEWDDCQPTIGKVYSSRLVDIIGSDRQSSEPITHHHENVASSLQHMYEEVLFHVLDYAYESTKSRNLCLSGGCAHNSVANGKILQKGPFDHMYVPSAAGDAGGAVGAAYSVWNQALGNKRNGILEHAFLGPVFSDAEIKEQLDIFNDDLRAEPCNVKHISMNREICEHMATQINQEKIVGWYQGGMEWGPRALGNRSILCDPRNEKIKDALNRNIKKREDFRPFAASVLADKANMWFEMNHMSKFMEAVFFIKEDKRAYIPAVKHTDGSCRVQTVFEKDNPLFYNLINAFADITGIPMLLNTSFNHEEPIVCRPEDAIQTFLRTRMDLLVMGNYLVERLV